MPSQLYKRGAEGTDEARTSLRSSIRNYVLWRDYPAGNYEYPLAFRPSQPSPPHTASTPSLCRFAVSMASAVSTFTAQNMGARQYDRVSEGYSISVKMMLLLSVTIAADRYSGRKIIYPPVRSKRRGCRAGTEFPVYALRVLSHIRDAESVYWVPTGHRQRDYSRCLQHNRPGSSPYAGAILVAPLGFPSVPYSEGISWIVAACLCYSKCRKAKRKF